MPDIEYLQKYGAEDGAELEYQDDIFLEMIDSLDFKEEEEEN